MKLNSVLLRSVAISAVLCSPVFLTGCTESDSSADSTGIAKPAEPAVTIIAAPEDIHSWTLTCMTQKGKEVSLGEISPSLQFGNKQRAMAYAGCNHIDGKMTLQEDGRIVLGEFSMTEMGCAEPVMSIENSSWAVLSSVNRFNHKDGLLTLSDGSPDNQLVFKPAEKQIKPVPDEQLGDPEETVSDEAQADSVTIENTKAEPVE